MRIKILVKTPKLPILYRHRVISLFKEALKLSDPDYQKYLFEEPTPKPYTFNVSLPQGFMVKKEPLRIDEKFFLDELETFHLPEGSLLSLWVGSVDYRFLISLYNGLQKLKVFNFSSENTMLVNGEKLTWEIKKVIPSKERTITKNKVLLKTCSSILIEKVSKGRKKPVLFNEINFEDELNRVMDKILKSLRGYGLKSRLSFKPVLKQGKSLMEKQKIKHTLKEFRDRTGLPYMTLTVNKGLFRLEGDIEDINYIVKIGIGCRTGQGFGMVEVIK